MRILRWGVWAAVAAACGGTTDGGREVADAGAAGCEYGGAHHQIGASFPASDGCNTCQCGADGVACTELGCQVPPDGGPGICPYAGQLLQIGDSFPASDGCNTCLCLAEGVSCTMMDCPPPDSGPIIIDAGQGNCLYDGQIYLDGVSYPAGDGCNTCFCMAGSSTCTALACLDAGPPVAVDPRAIDVWYFDVPTGAIRFYEIALCAGGRARLLTSFDGSGAADQPAPIEGRFVASSAGTIQIHFDVPAGLEDLAYVELSYDATHDMIGRVDTPDAGMSRMGNTGTRLSLLSTVLLPLGCD